MLKVLTLLARHDVAGAARLAHKNGEYYLALLISQAGSSLAFKSMLQKQLGLWMENRTDAYITNDRLRIFSLLAGIPIWETSNTKINTCEGMDWIKAIAHHLWYVISPVGSITDALVEYEYACGIRTDSQRDEDVYAAEPTPSYAQSPSPFRLVTIFYDYDLILIYNFISQGSLLPIDFSLLPPEQSSRETGQSTKPHLECLGECSFLAIVAATPSFRLFASVADSFCPAHSSFCFAIGELRAVALGCLRLASP